MIVNPIAKTLDYGPVQPPVMPRKVLDKSRPSSTVITPLHRLAELMRGMGVGDPSGALELFDASCDAKAEAKRLGREAREGVVPSKVPAGMSQAGAVAEATQATRERQRVALRDADDLYHQALVKVAGFGDGWVPVLDAVIQESLQNPKERESERRYYAARDAHDELRKLFAISTLPARVPPWVWVVKNPPQAWTWMLQSAFGREWAGAIAHAHTKPSPVTYRLDGLNLPDPASYLHAVYFREEFGIGLLTAEQVIDAWKDMPRPREREEQPTGPNRFL